MANDPSMARSWASKPTATSTRAGSTMSSPLRPVYANSEASNSNVTRSLAPAPSSAVCWNAGVACQGGPVYSSCSAVDRDVDGNPATDPDDAVLYTLDRYVSQLAETGAYIMAIDGVGSDGSVTYADSLDDPQFQSDFGIGPGCESVAGRAVPPVRIHQLVEMTSGPGNERSVCDGGYGSALATFGNGILTRLP